MNRQTNRRRCTDARHHQAADRLYAKRINTLERENDAIVLTRVRREIGIRLVEIRLLLCDGNLKGLNGGRT
jgi:hypothetical protein